MEDEFEEEDKYFKNQKLKIIEKYFLSLQITNMNIIWS